MVQVELKFTGATLQEVRQALIAGAGDLLQYGITVSPSGGLMGVGSAPNPSHVSSAPAPMTPPPSDSYVDSDSQMELPLEQKANPGQFANIHTENAPKKRGRKPKVQPQDLAPAVPATALTPKAVEAAATVAPPSNPETTPVAAAETLTGEHALAALQKMNDHFASQSTIDEALEKSKGVLAEFGATRSRDLKPNQYAAFIARTQEFFT